MPQYLTPDECRALLEATDDQYYSLWQSETARLSASSSTAACAGANC